MNICNVYSATKNNNVVFGASPNSTDPDETIRKIDLFGHLEDGWDFGRGSASPPSVVDKAKEVYYSGKMSGVDADAFPGIDGGINVAFYYGEHAVRVVVSSSLKLTLIHEVGIGIDYDEIERTEDVTLPYVLQEIKLIIGRERIWNSFEQSTWRGMIEGFVDFRMTASPIRAAVFPYSILNARGINRTTAFAST